MSKKRHVLRRAMTWGRRNYVEGGRLLFARQFETSPKNRRPTMGASTWARPRGGKPTERKVRTNSSSRGLSWGTDQVGRIVVASPPKIHAILCATSSGLVLGKILRPSKAVDIWAKTTDEKMTQGPAPGFEGPATDTGLRPSGREAYVHVVRAETHLGEPRRQHPDSPESTIERRFRP